MKALEAEIKALRKNNEPAEQHEQMDSVITAMASARSSPSAGADERPQRAAVRIHGG